MPWQREASLSFRFISCFAGIIMDKIPHAYVFGRHRGSAAEKAVYRMKNPGIHKDTYRENISAKQIMINGL